MRARRIGKGMGKGSASTPRRLDEVRRAGWLRDRSQLTPGSTGPGASPGPWRTGRTCSAQMAAAFGAPRFPRLKSLAYIPRRWLANPADLRADAAS